MSHHSQRDHTTLRVVTASKEEEEEAADEYVPLAPSSPSSRTNRVDVKVLFYVLALTLDAVLNVSYGIKDRPWTTSFTFTESMMDVLVLFGLRFVCGLAYVTMSRRMYTLAWWATTTSALLLVCKFFLIEKFTTFKTIELVLNSVLSIVEMFALKMIGKSEELKENKEKTKKDKSEDARAFFYDDPESHVNVSYLKLWFLFRPYFFPKGCDNQTRAALSYVCMLVSQGCSIYAPLTIGYATDALTRKDSTETVKYIVLYVCLNYAVQQLTELQNCVYQEVRSAAYRSIATKIFDHLLSLSIDWHLKKRMGVALRVIDRGQTSADNVVKYLVLRLLPTFMGVGSVVVLYVVKYDVPGISIILFLGIVTYCVLTIKLTVWRKEIRKKTNVHDNRIQDIANDCLVNIDTVKFFCSESFESERYGVQIKSFQKYTNHTQYSLSVLNLAQQVTRWLTTFGMLYVAEKSDLSVGDFVTVLTFASSMFAPLSYLGTIYGMVVQSFVDLLNVLQLLNEQPDVQDIPDAKDLVTSTSSKPNADGGIVFENVSFRYPSQSKGKGLKNISFRVKRGTTTAIVGTTGAGKTTIGRLLFRFYDCDSGRIFLNGQDISKLTKRSVRDAIGMVPQEKSLFNRSVEYNLRYGKRNASRKELERAADSAQILDFIESLDDSWETVVGERGLKLSGGEKQRVAIARALLKDPPYVVLDEATSALDTVTERKVQRALANLAQGRTQIIIAHRLSTIRAADQIIVLSKGRVVEQGNHDSLLKIENGIYTKMVQMEEKNETVSTTSSSNDDVSSKKDD